VSLHAGRPAPGTMPVVTDEAPGLESLSTLQDELRYLLNRWDPSVSTTSCSTARPAVPGVLVS
jgi:hypothetical protein